MLVEPCAKRWRSQDFDLMVAVRVESPSIQSGSNVCIPSLDEQTDWSLALFEVDAVIHLAARVHVMHEFQRIL